MINNEVHNYVNNIFIGASPAVSSSKNLIPDLIISTQVPIYKTKKKLKKKKVPKDDDEESKHHENEIVTGNFSTKKIDPAPELNQPFEGKTIK